MKKCPNCQKTYEDNLKFCQTDGTPLVIVAEDQPSVDPFKTMVATNLQLPSEELKPKPVEKPAVESAEIASDSSKGPDIPDDEEDVLEIPEKPVSFDAMKTIVASGSDTSDNIKAPDLVVPDDTDEPAAKKEEETPFADSSDSEAATVISPEIPKFSEPDIAPPDVSFSESGTDSIKKVKPEPETTKSEPSLPIPSPFDKSMPPGFAVPDNPPFEKPTESGEPEIVESSDPAPESPFGEQVDSPPASPFGEEDASPPSAPFAEPEVSSGIDPWNAPEPAGSVPVETSGLDPFGNNQMMSSSDGPVINGEGESKTLAIVSLILGITGVVCCGLGVLLGPAALVTGYMAKGKINDDPSAFGGGTFANIGMILGVVGILLSIIVIILNVLSVMSTSSF